MEQEVEEDLRAAEIRFPPRRIHHGCEIVCDFRIQTMRQLRFEKWQKKTELRKLQKAGY